MKPGPKSNTRERIKALLKQDPSLGRTKLARMLKLGTSTVQGHLCALRGRLTPKQKNELELRADRLGYKQYTMVAKEEIPELTAEEMTPMILEILQSGPVSPKTLADSLGVGVSKIQSVITEISTKYKITLEGGLFYIKKPAFGHLDVEVFGKEWTRLGLVADTHLACNEQRLEALHAQYDIFEKEGITTVFHAGNIVDGYIPKINGDSAICTTIDDQCYYCVDNYPKRKDIITHFITGDDHEGWWIKTGFNFGVYLEECALREGRKDLKYIGHVEADIEFKTDNGSAIVKISHPGGGSSYARSYTGQKTVESFEGGEKPAILVQGHYHVSNFMQERNVYVVGLPGFQDQTVFARKKRLRMEVGGGILEFKQNPNDGSVTRCRMEFNRFFDRGYYKPYLRSDARIVKGHLIIQQGKK